LQETAFMGSCRSNSLNIHSSISSKFLKGKIMTNFNTTATEFNPVFAESENPFGRVYKKLNLTQHAASEDQILEGVCDLSTEQRASLSKLLTVDDIPSRNEVIERCEQIAQIAFELGYKAAMIGGAPAMMRPLEDALRDVGIQGYYAFSKRESEDQPQADGSIRKVAVFKHAGWWPCFNRDDIDFIED
jgi:hypothetical protein